MNTEKLANDLAKNICAYLDALGKSDPEALEEIKRVSSYGVPLSMLVATQSESLHIDFFKVTKHTLFELCEFRAELASGWKYNYTRCWTNEVVKFDIPCKCGECGDK